MAEKVFSAPIIDNSNSAFAISLSADGKTYNGVYKCEFYAADLTPDSTGWAPALQYKINNGDWQTTSPVAAIPEYDNEINLATKWAIDIELTNLTINPILALTISIVEDPTVATVNRVNSSTINIQGVLNPTFTPSIANDAGSVNVEYYANTQTYGAIFADGLKHTISGKYSVAEGDNDYLSWYRIILKNEYDIIVEDTGRQPSSKTNKNTFSYTLQTTFDVGGPNYTAYVIYGTHKGWLETQVISIGIDDTSETATDIEILNFSAVSNAELGCVELALETSFDRTDTTTLVIKRFENTKVSVVYRDEPAFSPIITLVDHSAEAGVHVTYKAYYEYTSEGKVYHSTIKTADTVLLIDDIYLLGDKLLKVKYNPDLSSLKFNYADAITPTLGSAYPFARRNGHQKYRTFTIGGLISYNGEKYEYASAFGIDSTGSSEAAGSEFLNSNFLTDAEFEAYKDLEHYDRERIYEKIFRNKVLEFLHSPSIKLFKSLPEGDMLVRLSNISLTPNKQLDRNIYSFSATATEMAAATVENMIRFGITPTRLQGQLTYYNEYVLEGTMVDDETVETSSVENEDTLILEKVQTEI